MQKFINDPANMTDESLSGFVKRHKGYVEFTDCKRTIRYIEAPINGKVGMACGGGYGHDPTFVGFIGKGMMDAVAVGNVFSPPDPEAFCAAFRAANSGRGVVCLLGNFSRDIVNATKAAEIVTEENIDVRIVAITDDVANNDDKGRRGNTGEILVWKLACAAADEGKDIDSILAIVDKAIKRTRTIGVGLASCIIPEVGRPNYQIEFGTMEIGVSHHGLSSMETYKLRSADDIAGMMLDKIFEDIEMIEGDKVCVMISGLGNTMGSELNILYSSVYDRLVEKKIMIEKAFLGDYFTSLDMMGATLTILKLDDQLTNLLYAPAYPAAFDNYSFFKRQVCD